jgi:pyruvate/2-oxoglutarate dehydrogenase complex dihydrolipoamide dehydrogenase (E3) component
VLGGGPIGAELAQSFARFGSAVTVLHADERLLPRETPDAAAAVKRAFDADGVTVHNGAAIGAVHFREGEFIVTTKLGDRSLEVRADQLLVATGRRPNIESLGLDAAGVAFTRTGVTVNDRLRTSNPNIYAIGDVSSALQFTHVADAQARRAAANALFFGMGGGGNRDLVVPRVTYTSPEVAHVGATPDEAQARGQAVEVLHVDLTANDRSVLEGDDAGFLKVYLASGTDRIVGATLVAAHAGEMIGELGVAITHGLGLGKVGATIHAYPTQSDVFRRAADTWRRRKLTSSAKALFATWFRLFR